VVEEVAIVDADPEVASAVVASELVDAAERVVLDDELVVAVVAVNDVVAAVDVVTESSSSAVRISPCTMDAPEASGTMFV